LQEHSGIIETQGAGVKPCRFIPELNAGTFAPAAISRSNIAAEPPEFVTSKKKRIPSWPNLIASLTPLTA